MPTTQFHHFLLQAILHNLLSLVLHIICEEVCMSSSHRAFSSKFTCYKLSCLERIVFSSEGGPVAAVQMVIHVRVLMLTVQWMSTILKFSFESLQHYVFLSGKSDFHNDVLKMEIVKKFKQLWIVQLATILKICCCLMFFVIVFSTSFKCIKKICGAQGAGYVFPHFLFYSWSFNFRVKDFEGKLEFLTLCFFSRKTNCYFHVILLGKSLCYWTPDLPCDIFNFMENRKVCFISLKNTC